MSDLTKMPEFEAFICELARHASNGYLQSGCENTARALLAALDAKPEPPKSPMCIDYKEPVATCSATCTCDKGEPFMPNRSDCPRHGFYRASEPPKPAEDHVELIADFLERQGYVREANYIRKLEAERDALRKDITMIQAGYAECSAGRDALRAERNALKARIEKALHCENEQYGESRTARILRGDK